MIVPPVVRQVTTNLKALHVYNRNGRS